MERVSPGGMDFSIGSLRCVASAPDLMDKICIRCYRPGARIIAEKFRALAASDSFVIGSSPQVCHHPDRNNLPWSLLQWQCTMCQSKWMSYILYDKVYDCRLEDPFYSPMAILERSSMHKNDLQPPPHAQDFENDQTLSPGIMLRAQTSPCHWIDAMSHAEHENPQVNSVKPGAINHDAAAYLHQSSFRAVTPVALESSSLLSNSPLHCRNESWSAYRAMDARNDAGTDTDMLARACISTPGQCDYEEGSSEFDAEGLSQLHTSRSRATSDTATASNNGNDHRRGPHFDPEEYKKARGRGACELHKRNKKACRHPEHDHT